MYECVMSLKDFNGAGCILADDMGLGKVCRTGVDFVGNPVLRIEHFFELSNFPYDSVLIVIGIVFSSADPTIGHSHLDITPNGHDGE